MDLGVRDNLYVILGGSRGMGYAAAQALAADGARLALFSRTSSQVQHAAEALRADFGVDAQGYAADAAAQDGSFEGLLSQVIAERGTPRGLLVTSGVSYDVGTLLENTDAQWEAAFQDVLMCHVRAARAVLPHMMEAGRGQIVTTAAYSARAPKSFLFGYSDQKAAVVNFTKNVAKTYGRHGIRANSVCPGAFETQVVADSIDEIMQRDGVSREEAAAELMENVYSMPIALRRPGKAHEAGELMAFLLSERAAYLNGAIINIDGGTDF